MKLFERCPVLVKTVEHFRVNRVAGNHAVAVFKLARLHREVRSIFVVHLAKCRAHFIASGIILAVKEKPAANNLEAFVCRHGFPDGFHAPKGMLNLLQSSLARLATDLVVRFGNRGYDQAALRSACCFSELLNKGDEVVEAAGVKSIDAINLLGIGNELVHKDKAAAAIVE